MMAYGINLLPPVAYTYEADTHCPGCAFARFGRDSDGFIASGVRDGEGNEPGAIAPWESSEYPDGITCGTCLAMVVEPVAEVAPVRSFSRRRRLGLAA